MKSWTDGIVSEAMKAQDRYGPFTSTHEALGVLTEEVAELAEAIRENDPDSIRKEAKQVAAVAFRLYIALSDKSPGFYRRSNLRGA